MAKLIAKIITIVCVSFPIHGFSEQIDDFTSPPAFNSTERAVKDLPSSVTVITRSEIETLGLTNIEDILRLIPGMSVTQSATSRVNVSYHGTNFILPRRTTVLIDGMSMHRVGNSSVMWYSFPVNVTDIERVEIYRNHVYPKSGSKTLQATINIITRHPNDVAQNSVYVSKDTNGIDRQSITAKTTIGDTGMYVSFLNTTNPGFDRSVVTNSAGASSTVTPIDGMNDQKLTFRSSTNFNDSTTLDFLAGALRGTIDIDTRDSGATGWRNEEFKNYYINSNLSFSHDSDEFKVGAYLNSLEKVKEWNTCYPLPMFTDELKALYDSNPAYANTIVAGKVPSGGTAQDNLLAKAVFAKLATLGALSKAKQCGNINENFDDVRRVINIEHTHIFNDSFMLTSGYELQNNLYESATLAGGEIHSLSHNLHSTAHVQLSDKLGFSFGGNYYSLKMENDTDGRFSHHAGINYDYFSNQTIKFVYSKTHRNPDPLEQHVKWSYFMTDFSTPFDGKTEGYFYRTTTNTGNPVGAENYRTIELDFSGKLLGKRIEYDLKVFKEKMENLISQDLIFTKFLPTNDSQTELQGAEFLLKYHLSNRFNFIFGGSDINNDSTNINERSLTLKNSGYVSLLFNGNKNSASLSYYASNGIFNNSFDRVELNVRHNFNAFGTDAYVQGKLRYQPSDYISSLGQINASGTGRDGSSATMHYENKLSLLVAAGINF